MKTKTIRAHLNMKLPRSTRASVSSSPERQTSIVATLRQCVSETEELAVQNKQLREHLQDKESTVKILEERVTQLTLELAQKAQVEERNLVLQAQMLMLQRSEASWIHESSVLQMEEYCALKRKYEVLEAHFSELLDYVRNLEDRDVV